MFTFQSLFLKENGGLLRGDESFYEIDLKAMDELTN